YGFGIIAYDAAGNASPLTVASAITSSAASGPLQAQNLPAPPPTPISVIIDTDVGYSLDDAIGLAAALRAQQLGYFSIKAITTSTNASRAAGFVEMMLAHGGLTTYDIPIGAYK